MELYKHQKETLVHLQGKNKVAIYHDMGLGKTFTGGEKLREIGAKMNLVVCQKSKINDWVEHFKQNYDEFRVFDLTDKKQLSTFLTEEFLKSAIGVINYDLLWRRKDLATLKDFTLMLDESSLIQDETSKRSRFILKLKPANVILLSGTPTGGKYERLWSQLHLLGWGVSKELYWNHYVDYHWDDSNGFPVKIVDGYKNEDRLKRKMREYGCDFLKTEDVFDLPEQINQTIKVNSTKEYRVFKNSGIVIVGEVELVGDNTLSKMLYERMLCGSFNKEKIDLLKQLLESTDDRVIIFYNFNDELRILKDTCNSLKRDYSIINGQVKDLTAYEDKDDSVTLIQYQAGAMGLNLQKANKIIYFTPPLSSELFEQSKKRIHRIGQSKTCFYYYLTVKNSIEVKIYETLAMRRNYTQALFEGE